MIVVSYWNVQIINEYILFTIMKHKKELQRTIQELQAMWTRKQQRAKKLSSQAAF